MLGAAAVPAHLCIMNCTATCRGDSIAAAQDKTSTSRRSLDAAVHPGLLMSPSLSSTC